MKLELHYYDIYPKVFLVNRPVQVTVKPLGAHVAFRDKVKVSVFSMAHGMPAVYPERNNITTYEVETDADGCVRFTHTYSEESEYRILIEQEPRQGREAHGEVKLSVYALEEDMRGRYPFRGDLHMHTCRSDGRQCPAVVAANYRRNGYDFMVVSDHRRYYPSLEAREAFAKVPHEMNIVIGEEVHLPDNDIHIVNFGGKYSVNGLLAESDQNKESDRRGVTHDLPPILSEEEYRAEVNKLAEELDIPEGIEKFTYAACVWIFNHIRKAEGLGVFAHPYWVRGGMTYQVPESFCAYMTKTHPFDAFEVLGGERYYQHNGLQTQRYYEDRALGIKYPIVGSTDSHNSLAELHPGALIASTFVFAKENERASLISAIKDFYSVAVDTISEEYRIVGDLRFVKYVRFLLDDFTPLHDELCYEEGRLMKAYAVGEEGAEEGLRFIYGRMQRLFTKYFQVE